MKQPFFFDWAGAGRREGPQVSRGPNGKPGCRTSKRFSASRVKHWIRGIVFACLGALSLPAGKAEAALEASRPAVNRTVPAHDEPVVALALSANPTEAEIRQVRLFPEPLIPTAPPSADESRQLGDAIGRHAQRTDAEDASALEQFVAAQPGSAWTPALLFNLGTEYYKTGRYTKALAAWEKAWPLLQNATNSLAAKALSDQAAGELALMYARMGRAGDLAGFLDSIKGRVIAGAAEQKFVNARNTLSAIQNRPQAAFRCGPAALDQIRASGKTLSTGDLLVYNARSTTNGYSLAQLARLSRDLGVNYQMAVRTPGAKFILPAVIHLKFGHYAALAKEQSGRYLLKDPSFGNTWVSQQVLEEEGSGYFLVPTGGSLPAGWRAVGEAEGAVIWGKGNVDDLAPLSEFDECLPCELWDLISQWLSPPPGMAAVTADLLLASLKVGDNPVGYAPPVGPSVRFLATYNQAESAQPANFSYSNLGQKWTFNWLAYITDSPGSPAADVNYCPGGGGFVRFTGFDTNTQTFAPETMSHTILTRASRTSYSLLYPDGTQYLFGQPTSSSLTSRTVLLTQVVDPQGNAVHVTYDPQFRITALTDAIGQVTVFSYADAGDPLKITKVTDPFGRFATFHYNNQGLLSQITDCIGLTSQFNYDTGTFIRALNTPYGTTTFAYVNTNNDYGPLNWLVITHPDGEKERVEFNDEAPAGTATAAGTFPAGLPLNNNLNLIYRNSFYWDRNAYAAYAANTNDYSTARIYHWLHSDDFIAATGVEESEKMPLENRVYFNYAGQPGPTQIGTSSQPTYIGRVLDDGSTQLRTNAYNALGHVTNTIDPVGRRMTYIYSSNSLDLLEVHQTTGTNNDLLTRILYNSQHRPVAIYDAAGQLTTNTYNARGQLLTITDPLGETTTCTYDTNAYLLTVVGPLGGTNDTVSFSYDVVGRAHAVTNTDGYTLTFAYDNLDRRTNITYPDGTFSAFTYSNLDLVQVQDRMGRQSFSRYDSLRQLVAAQDPLGRITRFEYCGCGSLSGLIDPLGRRTAWEHDVQGRVTAKVYADGSQIIYNYENTTSRLKSVADEKGQLKVFQYYPDDNIQTISYPNAQNFTPTVAFAYDTSYNRMILMQDGIGTSAWNYEPVGALGALQVASITGPWNNETVTYQYDALGRQTNRAISGVAYTAAFDSLGRVTNTVNMLGSFNYAYDGATERVLDTYYPNGQASHFSYYNNLGDRRLQQITNQRPNASLISSFTYAYNPFGDITNWVQRLGVLTQTWNIGYDAADQVLNVTQSGGNPVNYNYGYDAAANRLFETTNSIQRSFNYNALNQLDSYSDTNALSLNYQWDSEQRLVGITQGTNQSQFFYDGLGRRVRIVETRAGVIQAERRFVWCGLDICEEWNSNNIIVNRFFCQGEQQSGTNLYYARDHLGSIRELTDNTSSIRAEYAYAPYGLATKLSGDIEANFLFTGRFRHVPSGLDLTLFRAYDAGKAHWLSRDPMGESYGYNLYSYVQNNPAIRIDLLGLAPDEALAVLRQRALDGDESALRAYKNLLNADMNINTGVGDDALLSAETYDKAANYVNGVDAVLTLGTGKAGSSAYYSFKKGDCVKGTIQALQAVADYAGTVFLLGQFSKAYVAGESLYGVALTEGGYKAAPVAGSPIVGAALGAAGRLPTGGPTPP